MTEIKTVKFESFHMDYFSFGNGDKAFVIVPGMSLKSVMLSADAIEAAYSCFADEYTVYVFDYASVIKPSYSVTDMADDLAMAMRVLDICDAYMFGASLGGMVIQYLAIRHSELVHKMVLASSMARQNDHSRTMMKHWKELALAGEVVELNRDMREHIYGDDYLATWHDAFVAIEADATPEELKRLAAMIDICLAFDAYSDLGKIHCPVLVIGSNDDRALTPDASRELADKLDCPIIMYDGYGHAVYDEAPDYKGHLLAFYKE